MNLEPLLIWAFDLLGPLLQVSDEVREQRNALLQDDYVSTKQEFEVGVG